MTVKIDCYVSAMVGWISIQDVNDMWSIKLQTYQKISNLDLNINLYQKRFLLRFINKHTNHDTTATTAEYQFTYIHSSQTILQSNVSSFTSWKIYLLLMFWSPCQCIMFVHTIIVNCLIRDKHEKWNHWIWPKYEELLFISTDIHFFSVWVIEKESKFPLVRNLKEWNMFSL